MKYESLYNDGMKPVVFSKQKYKNNNIAWHRDGFAISYIQNTRPRKLVVPSTTTKYYYTLSFSYTFQYINDTVFFAHCYPYSHTDLSNYLDDLASNPEYKKFLRINPLCKTIGGNVCHILTITQNIESCNNWDYEYHKLQRTTAGRRYMKIKEIKEEQKLRVFEYVKNGKIEEGKN